MDITLKHNNVNFKLLLIIVLLLILIPYVINSVPHALIKHKTDVQSAMDCLNANGSNKAFKVFIKNEDRRIWTCFDGTDWYIIITTNILRGKEIDREYDLRTTFKLNGETIEEYEIRQINEGAIQVDESLEPNQLFYEH